MRWLILSAVLSAACLPMIAHGDNCNAVAFKAKQTDYHAANYGGHHHFSYATQILIPVAVPADTFQVYGHGYGHAGAGAYYPPTSVASGEALLRLQLENADLKLKAAQRDAEEARRFAQQMMQSGAVQQGKPLLTTPAPVEQLPEQQPQAPQEGQAPSLDFVAHAILKLHCAGCHTGERSRGPKARGKVQMFNSAGQMALINTDPNEIWDVIASKHMPLGADEGTRAPVPDHEQAVIRFWAEKKAK